MLNVIWSIIVGFLAGLIARGVLPGADEMGFVLTTLVGIGGSVIGGLIGRIFNAPAPGSTFHRAGFIMSIVGAVVLLLILRAVK